MEIDFFDIAILLSCLFGSAFYSGSEAVLMSLGVDRARQLGKQYKEEGAIRKAGVMNFVVNKSNELLTTILVGNNIVNILLTSLTTTMASHYFKNDAIGFSVGVSTILLLFFGEIIPKTFARKHAERFSFIVIYLLRMQFYFLYPLVMMTVWPIRFLLGKNAEIHGRMITNRDIKYMVNKAEKEKTIDSKQVDLLSSVLDFPKIRVKDIMISRSEIKYIGNPSTFDEILNIVKRDTHSRYPVCNDDLENTIGFLHVKDLAFVKEEERKNFLVEKILKEPFFVYEHMKIQAVFDYMNRKKVHLALVKDEMGVIVGIITLEDIIEEVFGEIQDEYDSETEEIVEEFAKDDLARGVLVKGSLSIRDLEADYGVKLPSDENYSTVNGFLLDMLGNHFPRKGHIIVWEGIAFEITEVVNKEIKLVRFYDVDGEKHYFSKREREDDETHSPATTKRVFV